MTETGGKPPVSFPTKDVAVLLFFTAPADAARHKRCLWSVSRVRQARDGAFTAPGWRR
ncbi:hypothetical protein ECZC04_54380 [Escherichia coli]|nr:hypothetical protein ECZC04_54380 [Escherichia coli]